ncbi:M20/M25/M40 family metallo-hydrolase [Pseudoflavonifractor phocaeensis]|uniref:M20/M25/M40 family metallo-hydrolase n=1 Tax=Pseudoflavonifractor phocaeensis TaxID=1870988 RepID=UPI00195C451C|nr:M20/M25/M40 family metallo-hydrolase [Pseudoflavonifractor phocaeensis]MBM6938027.1 M20/M25/M40 family metallo-hydrolase [Pseudoflavonifractor phocaeensis]
MDAVEALGGAQQITEEILEIFRQISRCPRPSGHEEAAGKALEAFLEALGIGPAERDGAGNLLVSVPPTPGREDRPLLVLQGHMDMVCAVRPGSGFDRLTDAPVIRVRDGFVRTDGRSSLGADNHLGNAAVLWLLQKGVPHGPLRLLFTTAEEVGLVGAAQVPPRWLEGAWGLLNTDGFHYGRAIAGSAGGRRESYRRTMEETDCPAGTALAVEISGGTGGHSGDDIHRGRINAIQALAGFLRDAGCAVAEFSGGTAHNAIPGRAEAVVVLPDGRADWFRRRWADFAAAAGEAHRETDPHLRFPLRAVPLPRKVWTADCARDALDFLATLFNGVCAMHPRFPAVPGASANLGKVEREGKTLGVMAFLRCADQREEDRLAAAHDENARRHGFTLSALSRYPGWPGSPEDPLVGRVCAAFRRVEGREMEVSAVHVGLEPSVLGAKNPAMHLVSTGPDILDAHSVDERARLDTLPRYAALLAETVGGI